MRLINPIEVSGAILSSSTIAEPDASQGEVLWSAGSYSIGDEVIKTTTHRIYRCAVATSDDPEDGVDLDVPSWVDIGATNRYAMFDDLNGSKSIGDTSLIVELDPIQPYTALAMFYVSGADTINITMTDPIDGVVYESSVSMLDEEDIVDYYEWFFSPIISIDQFLLTDLPTYPSAILKVEINGGSDIQVGSVPFGAQSIIGEANHGSSFTLVDLSKKESDEFGNYTISSRPAYDTTDFDITVQRSRTRYVRNIVSKYRNKPVVWIGGENNAGEVGAELFTFGYYKSFRVNIDSPNVCSASLSVEELV